MTLFLIHNKEGAEEGRIKHASKIYSPTDDYTKSLHEHGHHHVQVRTSRIVSPDTWFVKNDRPRLRPVMRVELDKKVIKAGENDAVVFTDLPRGVQFKAFMGGFAFQDERIDATELEFSVPVPCRCQITFELWPYQTFRAEIEVVA